MRYVCRTLPKDTAPIDLEAKLNRIASHGWECISVTQRPAGLLLIFRAQFSNFGDAEIALSFLDAAL